MSNNNKNLNDSLQQLARLYGIEAAYDDVNKSSKTASIEGLLAVLKALDAPLNSLEDAPAALREKRKAVSVIEPVTVAWDGKCPLITLILRDENTPVSVAGYIKMESGGTSTFVLKSGEMEKTGAMKVEGERYSRYSFTIPKKLAIGYHRLSIEVKGKSYETLIISAPLKAYSGPKTFTRPWGAFLPLYALKTQDDWGSGDYTGLEKLTEFVAGKGGKAVSTLPLLPVFLDRPFDPSPYSPVSRLFWNEFYVDINAVPELETCDEARQMIQSATFMSVVKRLKESPMVDYQGIMTLKRRAMEYLSRNLSEGRLNDFHKYIATIPEVERYACFRATMEKRQAAWFSWPDLLRSGTINEGEYDEAVKHYYQYSQWLANEQVKAMVESAHRKGITMYFDLPLGVHPDGYDTWREADSFSFRASVGAPPDAVFKNGQNWGFSPLHPENIRKKGYRYVIDYLQHHLRHAGMLRLDHVMGLHRLFWIPQGFNASQGIYVRYHADEMYAILTLESNRNRSVIVGEDLGIVPGYVRPAMARHGLHRMYILRYELADNTVNTVSRVPEKAVASLNTHDMAPFAAFWGDEEIREKVRLGIINEANGMEEKRQTDSVKSALVAFFRKNQYLTVDNPGLRDILHACLAYLSASGTDMVLVNMEDLWLETKFQNVPGTTTEYPNWRRKARYGLEDIRSLPEIRYALMVIDEIRSGKMA